MDRDVQFNGAARLLIKKLFADPMPARGWREAEETQQIISEFLRQFAAHTIGYSLEYLHECGHQLSGGMGSRIAPSIPDMTTLPGK